MRQHIREVLRETNGIIARRAGASRSQAHDTAVEDEEARDHPGDVTTFWN
jgi:hypothetical protein